MSDCLTCLAVTQTKRYCALGRCYCGHLDCPAFDSFVDMSAIPIRDTGKRDARQAESWSNREDSTWIDQL